MAAPKYFIYMFVQELDSTAVSALGVRSRKLSSALNGQSWDRWPKPYHVELLRASEGTLSRWSRLHLRSLAPTNPHCYGPFSLWVGIHKEGLCPSSGDINRLMIVMMFVHTLATPRLRTGAMLILKCFCNILCMLNTQKHSSWIILSI
jgi:hypothetical protein